MAKSRIVINFTSVPSVNEGISIGNSLSPVNLLEIFKDNRLANHQTAIPNLIHDVYNIYPDYWDSYISDHYKTALGLDYNNTNLYTITAVNGAVDSGEGTVTIESKQSNVVFSVIENTCLAEITIFNEVEINQITIDSVTYSQATTDACNKVKLNITTNRLATIYNSVSNALNPFSYDLLRGTNAIINVTDADGNTATKTVSLPKKLVAANTSFNIVNSPTGATVVIGVSQSTGLILQFSLDNITFQESNVYSGLAQGSFTAYIKDQLGCAISVPFEVTEFNVVGAGIGANVAYADLPSKSNSIRYANRITHSNCGNYKNDENTLSCELPYIQNPRQEIQLFQACDVITTQIKSNYANIIATLVKEDLTEVAIPVIKKTNYIGLKDKRDAIKYNLNDGYSGIYFTSGNKYNYDSEVVEESYALNGALPEWGYAGNYVSIDNVWFLIEDVIYDESKDAEVLMISNVYTGADVSIIAGSIYDLFNYEVYEFDIDFADYLNERVQINITQTDARFATVVFLSEIIDVKSRQENTVEIIYYNESNTDILYSTDIIHKIRIPILYIAGNVSDDSESDKTDTSAYLVNSQLHEIDEFYFDLLTKEMMRKVSQALSHEMVTIDGVSYVKNDSIEATNLIGTNLYKVSAKMIKAGNVYNSQSGSGVYSEGTLEIPSLVTNDVNNFIEY